MIALIVILVVLLLLLAGGYAGMLFAMRRGEVFDPRDPKVVSKSVWAKYAEDIFVGLDWLVAQETEAVSIKSFDGLRLCGRLLAAEQPKGTLIAFHGYRSMAAVDFSCVLEYYHNLGYNLLLVDQRAHGHSEGKYLTFGTFERYDCQKWAEYCYERFGPEHPLFLDGVSMGASTVLMASDLPLPPTVRGVIADCGFTSPWEIIGHVMNYRYHLPKFPALYLVDLCTRLFAGYGLRDCSTLQSVAATRLPVLLLHGAEDHFVPCDMSRRAYEACRSEKQLLIIEGASHGGSYLKDPAACRQALEAFLSAHN